MKKEGPYEYRSDSYEDRLSDRIGEFDLTGRDTKKEIMQAARDAKQEVRQQKRDQIRDLKERVGEVKDHAEEYSNRYENRVDDIDKRARELKKEIRQEAKQAKKEIKERKNRFKEGVESIRDDLTDESQYHDYRTSGTAPMSSEGNYRARDAYGTVNNYEERILDHADRTAERMQQDVNDAAERIRKKVDRL
ncbi:hypothetical protein [Alistipes ihumii]|uniref:hypothetical protein n=1 Tax=Alistipes ihumii TaxID=1470347 RepID=UPI003079B9FE